MQRSYIYIYHKYICVCSPLHRVLCPVVDLTTISILRVFSSRRPGRRRAPLLQTRCEETVCTDGPDRVFGARWPCRPSVSPDRSSQEGLPSGAHGAHLSALQRPDGHRIGQGRRYNGGWGRSTLGGVEVLFIQLGWIMIT